MKKSAMILGNALIVLVILVLTLFYTNGEHQRMFRTRTEAFADMTVAMESVTTNYLLGEQQVCNSWSTYINANDMTAEEAAEYVRESISTPRVMGHILFTDDGGLNGLSTSPRASNAEDYTVSYSNVSDLGTDFEHLGSETGKVNVTRMYTNPVNAIQSIAFCRPVTLKDGETGGPRQAVLLRVIPVSSFEEKWVFPTDEYKSAELSLVDSDGDAAHWWLRTPYSGNAHTVRGVNSDGTLNNNYAMGALGVAPACIIG